MKTPDTNEPLRSGRLFGACCFNCESWAGSKRKQSGYCYELRLSGRDAPDGDRWCSMWRRRANSRLSNTVVRDADTSDSRTQSFDRPRSL